MPAPLADYWTNVNSMVFDMHAAEYSYATNVFAAANGGDSSSTDPADPNCMCRTYSPADRWTGLTCMECPWGATHNSIIVGAVMDGSRTIAPLSSWRNDPVVHDEVPHVVAPGVNILFPDNRLLSGTSYSTPAVVALLADAFSSPDAFWLQTSPEAFRALLMASACAYPIAGEVGYHTAGGGTDLRGGAGVPKGSRIKSMLANKYDWFQDTVVISGCGSNTVAAAKLLYFPYNAAPRTGRTTVLKLVDVCQGNINVYLSWMSSPNGSLAPGYRQNADDLDLYVTGNGVNAYSTSVYNSTEAVRFTWGGASGTKYLSLTSHIYSRTTNQPIWCHYHPTGIPLCLTERLAPSDVSGRKNHINPETRSRYEASQTQI